MIKIIFSDMDGTLLDDNNNLPAGFDEMIVKLKAHGVIFAPASGRQYLSLLRTFEKYENDFIFLAENGTMIMRNGKEIFSSAMSFDDGLEVLKVGVKLENIFSVFCGKKDAYALKSQIRPEYLEEFSKYYTHNTAVDNFEEIDDLPIKISFFDMTGKSNETIYPYLKQFDGPLQVVQASDYWVDVMNADINKGVAIQNIQRLLNISPDECAAFGDYLNDVQMLQSVTYSFAMSNAHPELKSFAKYETVSNNENGVLVGIERLMEQGLI